MITTNNSSDKITVIGGGLSGPVLALYLARRGFSVDVFEKRPDLRNASVPAGRSINLALSKRGITALEEIGVFDRIKPSLFPMHGRRIHDLNGDTRFLPYSSSGTDFICSVSRSDLNKILITEAENTDKVRFHFQHECIGVDIIRGAVTFLKKDTGEKIKWKNFPVIGTDGAGSVVRKFLSEDGFVSDALDPLNHAYKELNIPPDERGQFILDSNALHIWPRDEFMLIALPNLDKSFTVTLFLPELGKISFETIQSGNDLLIFFKKMFPDVISIIPELVTDFFKNPTGKLGTIQCSPWHAKDKAVLIGDAAHAIVPFFGQGMNASFEDCTIFNRWMDSTENWGELFQKFSNVRKFDTDAIGELALENYIEMRGLVNQNIFFKKKELERELEMTYPNRFISRYSMVSFHQIPYSIVKARGIIQEKILSTFSSSSSSVSMKNYKEIEEMIFEELPSLDQL